MSEKKFIGGLLVKAPSDKAPDYVKARLSIKREELIAWLQTEHGEWINADIKESQNGKWYAAVDDWKPNGGSGGRKGGQEQRQRVAPATRQDDPFEDSDIPFIRQRGSF